MDNYMSDLIATADAKAFLEGLAIDANDPRSLAAKARQLAKGVDAIYHGTSYPSSILAAGAILPDAAIDTRVFFTRCPIEAERWARIPRDNDEGRAAIFVFDKRAIKWRYPLVPNCSTEDRDELEDCVLHVAVELKFGLIGMVSEPFPGRTKEQRVLVSEHKARMCKPFNWIEP